MEAIVLHLWSLWPSYTGHPLVNQPYSSFQSGAVPRIRLIISAKGNLTQLEEEEPRCMDDACGSSRDELCETVGQFEQKRPHQAACERAKTTVGVG